MRFPAGAPVRLTCAVRDLSGALTVPSGISLAVRKPDGTTLPYPSPTADSAGRYSQIIPTTDVPLPGRYPYVWTTTGLSAGVISDVFDVYDPLEIRVISMSDAHRFLNIDADDIQYDSELQSWVDTIDEMIERALGGPILNRTITERVTATHGSTELALRQRPLVSVTSITDTANNSPLDLSDIDIDYDNRIVRRRLRQPWLGRSLDYNVVYVAGWGTVVSSPVQDAAKVILEHFWKLQHGPSARPSIGGEDLVTLAGSGYAVPNRAVELLSGLTSEAYI